MIKHQAGSETYLGESSSNGRLAALSTKSLLLGLGDDGSGMGGLKRIQGGKVSA